MDIVITSAPKVPSQRKMLTHTQYNTDIVKNISEYKRSLSNVKNWKYNCDRNVVSMIQKPIVHRKRISINQQNKYQMQDVLDREIKTLLGNKVHIKYIHYKDTLGIVVSVQL